MIFNNYIKICICSIIFLLFIQIIFANKNEINQLKAEFTKSLIDTNRVKILMEIAQAYFKTDLDSVSKYLDESLVISDRIFDDYLEDTNMVRYGKIVDDVYYEVADFHYQSGNYNLALKIFERHIEILQFIDNKKREAIVLNTIGNIHKFSSDYETAIDYYQQSLKLKEELKDTVGIAYAHIGIANVFINWGENEKARKHYNTCFKLALQVNDTLGMSHAKIGLGNVYKNEADYDMANDSYLYAKNLYELRNDKEGMALSLLNMGDVFMYREDYKRALKTYEEALDIVTELDEKIRITLILDQIGSVYFEIKNYKKAADYYHQSLALAKSINYRKVELVVYMHLSNVYKQLNDYETAYDYVNQYYSLKDTIFNEEKHKQIAELETKYETEKKEQQIILQNIDIEKKEAVIVKERTQKYALFSGGILFLILAVLIFRGYRQKKKANDLLSQKNEEIQAQRDLATQQRDLILEQKKEITDSIQYAYRIQSAMIPDDNDFKKIVDEFFVLYKPRNIVSGDFYWLNKIEGKIVIIAADCTGHGVPGAFMSMLGIAFLNEIVAKEKVTSPAEILNKLRENIIHALKQHGEEGEQKDGMDVAAITIDINDKVLEFAGANNPLYLIRNGEMIETRGNKMPVAIHVTMESFTNHRIDINTNDRLYIFSDGYADQFGGPRGKKFKYKPFKELLLNNQDKSMVEQKEILDKTFENWKGNYDQIDDICVIGVKI